MISSAVVLMHNTYLDLEIMLFLYFLRPGFVSLLPSPLTIRWPSPSTALGDCWQRCRYALVFVQTHSAIYSFSNSVYMPVNAEFTLFGINELDSVDRHCFSLLRVIVVATMQIAQQFASFVAFFHKKNLFRFTNAPKCFTSNTVSQANVFAVIPCVLYFMQHIFYDISMTQHNTKLRQK